MQTTVFFVRHAESDHAIKEDSIRPLTPKGLSDSIKVTKTLEDQNIHIIISSPYKRTVDTLKDISDSIGVEIITNHDFRERRSEWVEDFEGYSRKQWNDFDFKLNNDESLREVQERNIKALFEVIKENQGKNIIIGTHGTALSTIRNHFDSGYGFEHFWNMVGKMPYILTFRFEGLELRSIEEVDLK